MKIVDSFTFYNELDLLFYRLSLLNDVVDHFIIVEATKTHRGYDKPLFYLENKARFAEFEHKIIHVVDTDLIVPDISKYEQWTNEQNQRRSINKGVAQLDMSVDDLLIVTDLDEIPNPAVLEDIRNDMDVVFSRLQLDLYYFNLTLYSTKWNLASIVRYGFYKTMLLCDAQQCRYPRDGISMSKSILNAGWHLSYFGDVSFIQNKLRNFAEAQLGGEEYTNADIIKAKLAHRLTMEGNPCTYVPISENKNLPLHFEHYLQKYTG